VGDVIARSLINAGIYSVEDIEDWEAENIAQATQIGLKKAQKLKDLAREYIESGGAEEGEDAGEGEEAVPEGEVVASKPEVAQEERAGDAKAEETSEGEASSSGPEEEQAETEGEEPPKS